MTEPSLPPEEPESQFADIATRQSVLRSPEALRHRYGKAIFSYLKALLKNDIDAEEVAFAFDDKIQQGVFAHWVPGPGKKFRYYLKRAVHNAAVDYRRKHPRRQAAIEDLDRLRDPETDQSPWGQVWLDEWRRAVVNGAREKLLAFQQQHPGNLYYTTFRLLEARLLADGARRLSARELAADLGRETGTPCTEANARQLKSRTLQKFAELLYDEVRLSLESDSATPEEVEAELAQLGLSALGASARESPPDADEVAAEEESPSR
jgi:hypothetical protein